MQKTLDRIHPAGVTSNILDRGSLPMNDVPSAAYTLAQRLTALEVRHAPGDENGSAPAVRALEKLRTPLAKLSGVEGYRTLLLRALTLSKARAPSLGIFEAGPDGSLLVSGSMRSGINEDVHEVVTEDGIILLSELLGLLINFIGEALTLQLLRAAWPDVNLDHTNTEHKETPR